MFIILVVLFAAIQSCSDAGSFKIDYLKFDDIVRSNVPANVESAGTFNKAITSGVLNVVVKYGWIQVANQQEDICSLVGCPASGYSVAKKEFTIPGIAPAGGYTIKLEAFDQDKELIFCFSGSFTLKKNKEITSNNLYKKFNSFNQ